MPNVSDIAVPQQSARRSNATKRLIQAAALASALIPLGAVAVEGAPINCVTSETSGGSGGCFGQTGDYTAGSGEQTYTWKFFTDDDLETLLYTFEIRGVPDSDFSLNVADEWVGIFSENYFIDFPNSACIPLLDDQTTCVIFNVFGEAAWDDTYYIEIRWFADPDVEPGEVPNKPPDDGRNHIFRSPDGSNTFTDVLVTELYLPEDEANPADPALGGRGDDFSSFIAGRANVPEPGTLLLFGTAAAATLLRRRRRDR
jgi:hypothetical protein